MRGDPRHHDEGPLLFIDVRGGSCSAYPHLLLGLFFGLFDWHIIEVAVGQHASH